MKKLSFLWFVILCLLPILQPPAHALSAEKAELRLPAALTEIEEEAFAGVSADSIYLQDQVVSIGKRAFADCKELRSIRIPDSVTSIEDSAFDGCSKMLKIIGESNSEAQRFAKEKGLWFVSESDLLLPEV